MLNVEIVKYQFDENQLKKILEFCLKLPTKLLSLNRNYGRTIYTV